MAIYYQEAGPYEKFLQTQSFVKDINGQVKETGERLRYTISEETKNLIASNEILAETFGSGFNKVNGTLEWGFGRLEYAMQNVESAIDSLHSMLDDRLGHMLHYMEIQIMLQKGIWKELRIPDFKKEQRYYIQKGYDLYLDRLVEPALKSLLQAEASEEDFSEYKVLETIGHIYVGESECYNAEKALDYFIRAARFAEPERKNPKKAAEYYMHASWAAYLLRNFSKAIELVQKSINLNPQLSRSHYFLAKYNACLRNTDNSVNALEKAIRFDRNYCILVDIDGDFNNVRDGVLLSFDKLKNDAKIRAKQALDNANRPLDDLKAWGAADKIAALAVHSFAKALEKYASDTFFGYLDVLPLTQTVIKNAQDAVNAQKQLLDADHKSSLSKLEHTLREAERYNAYQHAEQEFKEASKLMDKIKASPRWDNFQSWEKGHKVILNAQELAEKALTVAKEEFRIETHKRAKRKEAITWLKILSPLAYSLIALIFFSIQNSPPDIVVVIAVMVLGPAVLVAILSGKIYSFFAFLGIGLVASIPMAIVESIVGESTWLSVFEAILLGSIGSFLVSKTK